MLLCLLVCVFGALGLLTASLAVGADGTSSAISGGAGEGPALVSAAESGPIDVSISNHPYEISFSYLTAFSTIKDKIAEDLGGRLKIVRKGLTDAQYSSIADGLVFKLDGNSYDASSVPEVKWKDGEVAAYTGSITLDGSVVTFDGENSPSYDIKITVTQYGLTQSNIGAVSNGIYDGTPKTAVISFVLNKDAANETPIADIQESDYNIAYTDATTGDSKDPVYVGKYRAKIESIDSLNYKLESVLTVNYEIVRGSGVDAGAAVTASGFTYNGKTFAESNGYIGAKFSIAGTKPEIELTDNAHGFKASVSSYQILEDEAISPIAGNIFYNVGSYNVDVLFTSPNYDDFTLELIYEIEAVAAEDVFSEDIIKDLGIFDLSGGTPKIILEYTGSEYEKTNTSGAQWQSDAILAAAVSNNFDFGKYNVKSTVNLPNGTVLRDIGEYDAAIVFESSNFIGFVTVRDAVVEIVKKTVHIPTTAISVKFNGDAQIRYPAVSTGIAGVFASVEVVSIKDKTQAEVTEMINAGTYTVVYKLMENEFVQAQEAEVRFTVSKGTKEDLEALIRENVTFNNLERESYDGENAFAPTLLTNTLDPKYGIVFEGVEYNADELNGNKDVYVIFKFKAENYSVAIPYEYKVLYEGGESSDGWVIFVVIGAVLLLGGGGYTAVYFVRRRRPVRVAASPLRKSAPVYARPKHKPASKGPSEAYLKKYPPVIAPPPVPKKAPTSPKLNMPSVKKND
jgi:hypothetical protein